MNIVREHQITAAELPGRSLRWMFHRSGVAASMCSMNVVEIGPGETVRPAHLHPRHEEIIYVVSGQGEVYVDGEVARLEPASAVLFSPGQVHMVRNPSQEVLKLVCFFAPEAGMDSYEYREDVTFPAGGTSPTTGMPDA